MSDSPFHILNDKPMDRRSAMSTMAGLMTAGAAFLTTSCSPMATAADREKARLDWEAYFQKHFQLMTDTEKQQAVQRLELRYELQTGNRIDVRADGPREKVLFGYAFNISKCRGYMDCVKACIAENNQDRASAMAYIRIHEHNNGSLNFEEATDEYFHQVPAAGHFYIGTQCFQCQNPPCVDVCPVKATWMEPDGIVVVDYNWCIGCRYCMAACPYDARRFNWADPVVPENEVNPNQHYLGNRLRKKGVVEKCTFCIQRSRAGENPACVEACPTGARIFGNLLDPNSEIRWVLANKKVFRLKEDLGTDPKFWYFMD
jgi:Fe-S-cluster-containing dehydrogenase component